MAVLWGERQSCWGGLRALGTPSVGQSAGRPSPSVPGGAGERWGCASTSVLWCGRWRRGRDGPQDKPLSALDVLGVLCPGQVCWRQVSWRQVCWRQVWGPRFSEGQRGSPSPQGVQRGCQTGPAGTQVHECCFSVRPPGGPCLVAQPEATTPPPPPPLRSPRPGPLLGTASSPPGVRLTRRRPAQCRALCTSVGSGRLLEGCVRGQRGSGPSIPPGSQIGGSAVTEHATQFCARGARACASPASLLGGWGGGAPQTQGPGGLRDPHGGLRVCGGCPAAAGRRSAARTVLGPPPRPGPQGPSCRRPAPGAGVAAPPHTSVWGAAERAGPSCLRDGLALCPRTATGQCCWWRPPGGHSALSRLAVLGPAGLPDASRAGLVPPDHVPHGAVSVAFWRLLLICVTP